MRWEGFLTRKLASPKRPLLRIEADFQGPDEEPVPIATLIQGEPGDTLYGTVYLTAEELTWIADESPAILERMRARP